MNRLFQQKRAQSTLEYALLIAAIVGGLVAINHYTHRAMQGRVRSSIDDVGTQYSAGHVTSEFQTTRELTTTTESFGVNPGLVGYDFEDSTTHQGTSYFEVDTAGIVTQETTEGHDETITWTFSEELEQEGLIPD